MIGRVLRNTTIVVLAVLWLVPTYLLLVNGMTSATQYTGTPHWYPTSFGLFDNIATAWKTAEFGEAMLNSLLYATISAAVAVGLAALAGFAAVVMPTQRRVLWFWIIYAGTLFPLQVFLRPLFGAYAGADLYNTRLGMFLVYTALCIPFAFFVLRNYLTMLGRDLTEAARLDGASWWRIFRSVHLPLSGPALAAAFIFQFVWVWNDLIFGITLTYSPEIRPVMAALSGLQGTYTTVGPPVVLAGAFLVSIPTVVLFFAFQRMFVSSLKITI